VSDLRAFGYTVATAKGTYFKLNSFSSHINKVFAEIEAEDVAQYLNRKEFCNNTRTILFHIISCFFNQLLKNSTIKENPMSRLIKPKSDRLLPSKIMTKGEAEKVLEVYADDGSCSIEFRNRTILELLYSSSLRRSELVVLDIQDVDLRGRTLHIRKSKNGDARLAPITETACSYLREYIERHRRQDCGEALFISYMKRRVSANLVTNMVTAARRQSGIKTKATSHSFRKTSATLMLQNGCSLAHLQKLLGHRNMSSSEVYTKVTGTDVKKMVAKCHPREREKNLKLPELKTPEFYYGKIKFKP
jgi:integrase/recombinase XerD